MHYTYAADSLANLRKDFFLALDKKDKDDDRFGSMVELTIRRDLPHIWIHNFLDAMMMDTHTSQYQNYENLQKYMYGSAEVIGLMMCHIV
jgi:phytoene synthase